MIPKVFRVELAPLCDLIHQQLGYRNLDCCPIVFLGRDIEMDIPRRPDSPDLKKTWVFALCCDFPAVGIFWVSSLKRKGNKKSSGLCPGLVGFEFQRLIMPRCSAFAGQAVLSLGPRLVLWRRKLLGDERFLLQLLIFEGLQPFEVLQPGFQIRLRPLPVRACVPGRLIG